MLRNFDQITEQLFKLITTKCFVSTLVSMEMKVLVFYLFCTVVVSLHCSDTFFFFHFVICYHVSKTRD